MENPAALPFAFALPLLLTAAALLLFPACLAPSSRGRGAVAALAVALLSGFAALVLLQPAPLLCTTLALLGALIATAPLLDRARLPALALAGCAAGLAATCLILHQLPLALPPLVRGAALHLILIAALVVGFAGSMALPPHPSRITAQGALRVIAVHQGIALAGWSLLALCFAGMGAMLDNIAPLPVAASALAAALVALFSARAEDGLQKAGEALAAGVLVALLAPLSLEAASALGIVAGFFVSRGEAITAALRIDDAAHLAGALLIPAILGLLAPGFLTLDALAAPLAWLGATLLLGLAIAAIVWPVAMLSAGLALPPRRVREGGGQ
jgi:hypothetical protein